MLCHLVSTLFYNLLSPQATTQRYFFIDYSSAFNTILPSKLFYKLQNMGVQNSLCHWILDFLYSKEHKLPKSMTSCHKLNTLALVPPRSVYHHLCYILCT